MFQDDVSAMCAAIRCARQHTEAPDVAVLFKRDDGARVTRRPRPRMAVRRLAARCGGWAVPGRRALSISVAARGVQAARRRLGVLGRTNDLLGRFETGPNPFDGGNWAGRVRHVAPLLRGNILYVFTFSFQVLATRQWRRMNALTFPLRLRRWVKPKAQSTPCGTPA
jgi:hypothetical protein